MIMTQLELIKSLDEGISWLRKEINFGVQSRELRHIVKRIGEMYAAVITNGAVVPKSSNKRYDVIGGNGQKIAVKTLIRISPKAAISFNPKTIENTDRLILIRLDIEELTLDILLDKNIDLIREMLVLKDDRLVLEMQSVLDILEVDKTIIATEYEVKYKSYILRQLENGKIEILTNEKPELKYKKCLREISKELGLPIYDGLGIEFNTRQLGNNAIKYLLMSEAN